ncbi:MAG: hormogonium polysaccharide secretion pseudopilin HpsB [Nodularia sp. (in: cyanobacteria)]|nr:hormogonium polysaccharide secretion pseudopilin HpsB [Nodularia sp. (in: cyanobacteria)]
MIKQKQQQNSCPGDESGFTIIESIVALVVAAILLTAIAPVIVLSTATRVQSRRIELATQAVRTYIDSVRTGSIEPPSEVITLESATADAPRLLKDKAATADTSAIEGKPDEYLIDMELPESSSDLYCFKRNGTIAEGECTEKPFEFYIQAAQIKVTDSLAKDGYRLGIRVYRGDIDFAQDITASDGDTKTTQTTFTGGLGSRQSPLIEMTTDIGTPETSFRALCQRLGVADGGCD